VTSGIPGPGPTVAQAHPREGVPAEECAQLEGSAPGDGGQSTASSKLEEAFAWMSMYDQGGGDRAHPRHKVRVSFLDQIESTDGGSNRCPCEEEIYIAEGSLQL
jgi:hypothetical protein